MTVLWFVELVLTGNFSVVERSLVCLRERDPAACDDLVGVLMTDAFGTVFNAVADAYQNGDMLPACKALRKFSDDIADKERYAFIDMQNTLKGIKGGAHFVVIATDRLTALSRSLSHSNTPPFIPGRGTSSRNNPSLSRPCLTLSLLLMAL
jgi:hypothetical protein